MIDGRRLYYRGLDATALAASRSLEEVAALIWTGQLETASRPRTAVRVAPPAALPFIARAQSMLAAAAARDPLAMDLRAEGAAATGWRILRLLATAATGKDPADAEIHRALARSWRVGSALAHRFRRRVR